MRGHLADTSKLIQGSCIVILICSFILEQWKKPTTYTMDRLYETHTTHELADTWRTLGGHFLEWRTFGGHFLEWRTFGGHLIHFWTCMLLLLFIYSNLN